MRRFQDGMILVAAVLLAWFFLDALFQPFPVGFGLNSDQLSDLRLTQALSLLHGLKYPSLDGGVLLAPIYGPVGFCFYWPAAFFSLPSSAMLAAQIIATACFFVPALLIFVGRNRWHGTREGVLAFLAFGILSCTLDALKFCAFWVHADAPALGLAMAAAGLLYAGGGGDKRRVLSAVCVVLSIWAKQTMLPVVGALVLYVWIAHGRREAVRYVGHLLLSGAVVTAAVIYFFGVRDVWLNMILVPFYSPWIFPDKWEASLTVLRQLFLTIAVPCALLLLGLYEDLKAGLFKRGFSSWLASNPWFVFMWVGIFLLPSSFLGKIKIGAAANNLGLALCFLLISALLSLIRKRGSGALTIFALILLTAAQNWPVLSQNPIAPNEKRFVADKAWRFALEHPEEVYFPGIPLAGAMADNKFYHSGIGIWEREISGFPVPPYYFSAGLPARMKWIIFGPPFWYMPDDLKIMKRFPDWSATSLPELPGWTVFSAPKNIS